MPILSFMRQWGGGIIMSVALLVGIPDSFMATKEIVSWVSPWGMQPIHIAFWLLGVGSIYTAIIQGVRIRNFEKREPRLHSSLLPFPLSGTRIVWLEEGKTPMQPQKGYAKIAVRNTGGLLEDCVATVTGIAKVSVLKGKLQITPLVFTSAQLSWDDGNVINNIPNDSIDRYLNLAYLDQNKPSSWQLAITRKEEYFSGWHKISVVVSSSRTEMKPLKIEVALGFGGREVVAPPLNLWPWDKWHESILRQIEQAPDKEGFRLE